MRTNRQRIKIAVPALLVLGIVLLSGLSGMVQDHKGNSPTVKPYPYIPSYYNYTLQESGLPAGTTWNFKLTSPNGSLFYVNGTQSTGTGYTTYSGSTTKSIFPVYVEQNNFINVTVYSITGYKTPTYVHSYDIGKSSYINYVNFTKEPNPKYQLTVKESGLPIDEPWSFTFNGTQYSISNSSYNFQVENGSYTFSASSVNGYEPPSYTSPITVDGSAVTESVTYTAVPRHYKVTINETGLSPGRSWTFSFNGTQHTISNTSYNFSVENGTYSFFVQNLTGYTDSYTNHVNVFGSDATGTVTFTKLRKHYNVTVQETGLKKGVSWRFSFNGTQYTISNTSYRFSVYNGTYSLSVANVPGYYSPSYSSTVTVSGKSAYGNVTFRHLPRHYSVYIQEFGLATGTNWTFTFNGTAHTISNTSYDFLVENGTYSLSVDNVQGHKAPVYASSITVNGVGEYGNVTFSNITRYKVEVEESGLPAGKSWTFTFNGTPHTLTNASYDFSLVNGTYNISVNSVSGYTSPSYTDPVNVSGSSLVETVSFVKEASRFKVRISDYGLPNGTAWSFTFNGTGYSLVNGTYNFTVVNGTYSFTASSVTGYGSPTYFSPITVNGSSVNEVVTYTANNTTPPTGTSSGGTYGVTVGESGLPSGTEWSIFIYNASFNETFYSNNTTMPSIKLPNGTYHYNITSSNPNYTAKNGTGNFTIKGSPFVVGTVTFVGASVPGKQGGSGTGGTGEGSGPGGPGPSGGSSAAIIIVVVGIIVAFLVGLIIEQHEKQKDSDEGLKDPWRKY